MKTSRPRNRFQLENLEQRILLSGDPLTGVAPLLDGIQGVPAAEEFPLPGAIPVASSQTPAVQSPSAASADLFSGLTGEALQAAGVQNNVAVQDAAPTGAAAKTGGRTALAMRYPQALILDGTLGGPWTQAGDLVIGDGNTLSITTHGGDINFTGNINGTAGGGVERLILDAGTGTITIDGMVGNIVPLESLTIVSAGSVVFNNLVVLNDFLLQQAGTGTEFRGNVTVGSLEITTTNSITFGAVLTPVQVSTTTGDITLKVSQSAAPGLIAFVGPVSSTGGLTIAEAKDVTFSNHTVSVGGALAQTVGANSTTFAGTVVADSVNLNVQNLIQFSSILNVPSSGSGHDITLISDEINFSTTADTVIGTGSLTLKPYNNIPIDVGNLAPGSGTRLELNPTDLAALTNGFAFINIGGQAANTNEGAVLMGPAAFKDPLHVYGTQISVTGAVTGDTEIHLTSRTGNITLDSGGSLTAANAGADVTLTAATDILLPSGSITAADEVTLTANGGKIEQTAGTVTAATLKGATATGLIKLNTAVTTITKAESTTVGAINITETDGGLTLTEIRTQNGPITILSNGEVTATSAVSTTTGNDIFIHALSGNILVGQITIGGAAGNVILTADLGAILDNLGAETAKIIANAATLTAAAGIGTLASNGDLDVQLNTLSAENTGAAGDIVITELAAGGALAITKASQSKADGTGGIRIVTEGGAMTVSGPVQAASGKVTLQASLGLTQNAGANIATTGGDINVLALGGAIFVADSLTVQTAAGSILYSATGGISLGTGATIASSGSGNLTLLTSGGSITQNGGLASGGGTIDVEATAGDITMATGVSAVTTGKNIRYKAGAGLTLALLDARSGSLLNQENWGQVSVTAGGGSISDASADDDAAVINIYAASVINIYAAAARLYATAGIGTGANAIETELGIISATGGGSLYFLDATGITAGSVGVVPAVRVQTGGTISVQDTADQSGLVTTTASNGVVVLRTVDGPITVNGSVSAGGAGNVLIQAQGATGSNVRLNAPVTSASGSISVLGAVVGNAYTSIRPLGVNNDLRIQARTGGAQFDGVQVKFIDDNSLSGNSAVAVFSSVNKILSINIRNGETTANAAIAAIDAEGTFDAFRDTTVETANDGSGVIHTADSAPSAGGSAGTSAVTNLSPLGGNNDLIFTAARVGSDLNGVKVRFIDDGILSGNVAQAVFDTLNQRLTIKIVNGVTTAAKVVAALAAMNPVEILFSASFNTVSEPGNDGSGVVHTAPAIMGYDQTVAQTAAGDISVTAGAGAIDVEAPAGSISMADGAVAMTPGGNLRYRAADSVIFGLLDARKGADQSQWGSVSVAATAGSITDAAAAGDASVKVYAKSAQFQAGNGIGEFGAGADSIETEVMTLAAAAGSGGIYLVDATAVEINTAGPLAIARVIADGTAPNQTETALSDLVSTAGGSIVLRTVNGAITVNDGAGIALTGVSAAGAGIVTLEAQGSGGDVIVNADIFSDGGALTVTAGGAVSMAANAGLVTNAQNITVTAAGDAILGRVDARTAANRTTPGLSGQASWGQVNVTATGGGITDASSADSVVNIYAKGATLQAKTKIGQLLVADGVLNPIETEVATLTAMTTNAVGGDSGSISIVESTDVSVSDVNSGAAGSIVIRTVAGSVTVNDGADADVTGISAAGSVILDAQGSGKNILMNADIVSAGGTLSVTSGGGSMIMGSTVSLVTDGQAITVAVATDAVLGQVDARTAANRTTPSLSEQASWGQVNVTATGGGITDASSGDSAINIYAKAAQLRAKTKIGQLVVDGDLNPIETEVAALSAATTDAAAGDKGSISIAEATDVAVSDVNSGSAGSIVIRTAAGSITVNDGAVVDTTGVRAAGAGNILLEAQGGGNVTLNARTISAGGNVTVLASGNVALQTAGGIIVTAGLGTVDVQASGDVGVAMTGGSKIQTAGGNLRVWAAKDVVLSLMDAGAGGIGVTAAAGSVSDGDDAVDILAGKVRLKAASGIGSGTDPLEIAAGTVSAYAGPGGLNLLESDGVTVGPVDIMVQRVKADGTLDVVYDARQSGLDTSDAGFVLLKTTDGAITVVSEPAVAVLFPEPNAEAQITLTADTGGMAYNGYWIRLEDDVNITNDGATAVYDSAAKKLTIKVNSLMTTAGKVAAAIESIADFPFIAMSTGRMGDAGVVTVGAAGLDYFSKNGSERGAASEVSSVTAGGGAAVAATAILRPTGTSYGISFTAIASGTADDGVTIRILDDGAGGRLTDGTNAAQTVYDGAGKTLDIYINNGYTTVGFVIDAVKAASVPFTAALTGSGSPSDVLHTAPVKTVVNIPARISVRPPGANNDLYLEAATAGIAYNGVTVRFLDDGSITDNSATAAYDALNKILTIRVKSDLTDANAVVAAVNAQGTFVAGLDKSVETANSGTGKIQSTVTLTSGGSDTTQAQAVVRPEGADNDILFKATAPGAVFNGVSIRFAEYPINVNGAAAATYDDVNKIMTITVQNRSALFFTDAQSIINAVNSDLSLPFSAMPAQVGENKDIGSVIAFVETQTSGGISDTAEATFSPLGANNDIRFQAKVADIRNGDVTIQLVDDGTITDSSATAVYDPDNKSLTINIQNGETTAATVINAVNNGANSASNPFTASNAAGSSGAGVIHTPATITGGGGDSAPAWVRVKPAGSNNDFDITSSQEGTSENGVAVVLVHDGSLDGGVPQVTYTGSAGASRTILIKISNGLTTARQVIVAVNKANEDGVLPFGATNYGLQDGTISTGAILYGASGPGFVSLATQGAASDLNIQSVLSSTVGAMNLAAGRDILFSGATGAVTAAGAVTLQAGRSIANTASTAATTIAAAGQTEITLTSGDRTAVASTRDLKATSQGKFTLLGAGLALNGANLTVTAADDISIQAPIAAANETVTITSADNISIAAAVTAAAIRITSGTDGGGDVGLGAGANLAGGTVTVDAAGRVTMADGSIISSGSETIHIAAGQDIALSALTSASGPIEVLAGGSINDNTAAETANISTPGLATLTAVNGIGGLDVADLDTQVGQLDALNTGAAGDIVIEETAIGGAIDVRRAYQSNAVGTGSILISAANGTVTLVEGQSGVKADGTGHILIQALDTDAPIESDVVLSAAVTGAGGHVSVIAADGVDQRANITAMGAGTIGVQAGAGGISMAGSATSASANQDIRYSAAGNITIGLLNAGTGNVSLVSTAGSVLDNGNATGLGVDLLNVQAAGLGIDAFVGAGELGAAGTGKGALETRVDKVAAKAGSGGISLLEEDGVAIGSVGVSIGQVTMAGFQGLQPYAALSGLSTLAGGAIVLQTTDGTITVGGAGVSANGAGNILLNAQDDDATVESDLILTAAVQSGSGRISLIGADRLEQKADVTTAGGSIDVKATAGALIMDAGTVTTSGGGNIRYRANGDVSIGSLNAGSGSVSIVSDSGRILDSGNGNADVTAGALRLNAPLAVGELSGGNGPLDIAAGKVSAATGAGGISLSATGDISVENVAVSLWRVKADGTTAAAPDLVDAGQSDLTTTAGGSIVLASTGAITLKDGNGNFTAVNADTTGNIRLAAGGLLAIESGVRSGSGALTLLGAGISQTADGDLMTIGTSIDVEATAGSIAMADGASAVSSGVGDVRYKATGNIQVGNINAGAGNVSLIADSGSITDNGDTQLDIQGAGLRLRAGGGVGELGTGKGALETAVNTLSAYAGAGGISLYEADGVTVGPVAVGVTRVAIDGTAANVTDAAQSDLVTGANGAIVLRTVNGTLTVTDGNSDTFGVRSVGSGNILLQAGETDATPESDLVMQVGVISAGGSISLIAADSVTQEGAIATNGASIDVQAIAGAITMGTAAQTTSSGAGDVRYEAATHIQVGGIDAGAGNIGLVAGTGSILDNDAPASMLAAVGLRLQAASAIGEATGGNGPLEIAVEKVSALAGAGGIALTESNDITVDTVAAAVKRVTADGGVQAAPGISHVSQSDLTATGGGAIVLTAGGGVILKDNVVAEGSRITIHAAGAILEGGDDATSDLTAAILNLTAVTGIHGAPTLEVDAQQLSIATQSGLIDIRNLNASGAPVTVDPLTTAGGSVRYTQAAGDLTIGEVSGSSVTISAAGSVIQPATAEIVTTGGGISIESTTGSIVMADGATDDSAGGNIVYKAAQDVVIGNLNAGTGDVGITATGGSILAAGAGSQPEVIADRLKLIAGDGVGTTSQPLDTKVNVISASSGSGGVDLVNDGTVEIGTVGPITTEQVRSDGTVVVVTDQPLIGITVTGGGSVVQRVTDGTLNVNAPITTTGTGDIVLQARDVAINETLVSESKAFSVVTKDGATFSWTAVSGATQYYLEIIRNGSVYEALMVAGTRWIPAYIFPQGSYTWTVRPVTATGMGAASAPGSFQITARPEALTPSGTIAGGGSLTFQWTAVSGTTQYKVEIYKDGAFFNSGLIDGLTVWTPGLTFGAGVYQWTVQSSIADVFGLKSDPTEFLVPAAGAAGQPAPLNPAVSLTGGGPAFSWTAVSGVRWYRVIVEKNGQVVATQFLDNVTTWTPTQVFGAGSYRWTVQSWKTVGFGTVAAALFTIPVSPLGLLPMPGSAAALGAGETAASAVPMAFSTSAVRVNSAGEGVSVSASADAGRQEASAGTDSAAAEPASPSALAALGAYGTAAPVMTPDAAASAISEVAAKGDQRGDALPGAEETAAAGIIAAVRYPDSLLAGEERTSSDRGAASLSGQATNGNSQPASLQNAEDGGSDLGQTGETGVDLVNARRGYIAPIDIVVGPMTDSGAKQASLIAKKIAEKPVREQA